MTKVDSGSAGLAGSAAIVRFGESGDAIRSPSASPRGGSASWVGNLSRSLRSSGGEGVRSAASQRAFNENMEAAGHRAGSRAAFKDRFGSSKPPENDPRSSNPYFRRGYRIGHQTSRMESHENAAPSMKKSAWEYVSKRSSQ